MAEQMTELQLMMQERQNSGTAWTRNEKFDKDGLYVKKWVPELNKVPSKFIHKPWEMELKYQQVINTFIGKDYPKPIVIHEEARASALNAFQSLKKN